MNSKVVTGDPSRQGNSVASTFRHGADTESSFRDSQNEESDGKPVALSFLNQFIDASGIPRKEVAGDVGKSEATFSKMTSGTQAFGLDDFEKLPRAIQVAWLKAYCAEHGLEVRDLDLLRIADELLARFDEVANLARLIKIGRPRMAKASGHDGVERRRA